MNRFEWMMVLLCGLGLAYAIIAQKPMPSPVPAVATAPAQPGSAAATPSGENASSSPGTPDAPAAPAETLPAAAPELTILRNAAAEYTFTTRGGGLQQVRILSGKYAGRTEQLMNRLGMSPIGGLLTNTGTYDLSPYRVVASSDRSITYEGTVNGVEVVKAWTMHEGEALDGWGYVWDLKVSFRNPGSTAAGDFYLYAGLLEKLHSTDILPPGAGWYSTGSAEKLEARGFEASSFLGFFPKPVREEIRTPVTGLKWGGVHNQFYTTLVSPLGVPAEKNTQLLTRRRWLEYEDPGRGQIREWEVETSVEMVGSAPAPGATSTWAGEIYTGPRSGTVLNLIGGERNESMPYGWFSSLSRIFLGALNWFHQYVSFGLAIVFLTIVVRLVIWPLSLKATKSMKRMAKLSPLMQELKDKYKDDPQKMQVETMKLYKDYGVNPVGGCLPVLLQFPIFLGYYQMMQGAVEMRGHPFLWVDDLSLPDTVARIAGFPLNPLPLVMAVTMYIQMKVAPQPTQTNPQLEMQQKLFKIMPLFFLMFCYNTASALALYWSVQNVISIFQTWIASRQPDEPLVKMPRQPSFLERAQAAALEQQRAKGNRPASPGGGKSTFKKG